MTINIVKNIQVFGVPFDKTIGADGVFTLSFIYEQDLTGNIIDIPIIFQNQNKRWLTFGFDVTGIDLFNGQGHYTLKLDDKHYLDGRLTIEL